MSLKGSNLRRSAVVLCVPAMLLGGCATAEVTVDEDTYRAAFQEFIDCMDSEGFPVMVVDDTATIVDYAVPGAVVGTPAEELCYGPFRNIDMAWQVQNEDSAQWAVERRECLKEQGVQPAGSAAGDWELILEHQLESVCP